MAGVLLLGAVAYDPKVVTIWDGFRRWFRDHDLPVDYLLYAHYEHQVEDLVAGRIHLAWNSPLAWVRAERLAAAAGRAVRPVAMRDTDRDLTSVLVVSARSGVETEADLAGSTIAAGAVDSPQAHLIPAAYLADRGIQAQVRTFEVGVGLHGDHLGGERDAARALAAGTVDAAMLLDASHLLLIKEGTLPAGSTRIVAQTDPYDHCAMTAVDTAPDDLTTRFVELLLSMSYADPQVRPLLDLEGLTRWQPGRTEGYRALTAAVDRFGFYGPNGEIRAAGYAP